MIFSYIFFEALMLRHAFLAYTSEQSCELEEYDGQLVRKLIEKVTVFDNKLTVEFKSGVEIDVLI